METVPVQGFQPCTEGFYDNPDLSLISFVKTIEKN
jgi:hypothetical protein